MHTVTADRIYDAYQINKSILPTDSRTRFIGTLTDLVGHDGVQYASVLWDVLNTVPNTHSVAMLEWADHCINGTRPTVPVTPPPVVSVPRTYQFTVTTPTRTTPCATTVTQPQHKDGGILWGVIACLICLISGLSFMTDTTSVGYGNVEDTQAFAFLAAIPMALQLMYNRWKRRSNTMLWGMAALWVITGTWSVFYAESVITQNANRPTSAYTVSDALETSRAEFAILKSVVHQPEDRITVTNIQTGEIGTVPFKNLDAALGSGYVLGEQVIVPNSNTETPYRPVSQSVETVRPDVAQEVRRIIIQESWNSYAGSCPCPYFSDRRGHRCGRRSAYNRAGGASPLCFDSDVSDDDVLLWIRNWRTLNP